MDRSRTTALLRQARSGSKEAFETLFERYAGKLLALIRLRMDRELRSRLESRDVLNASLLKAFERIDQFERSGGSSLMGWLARIAENEIRDQRDYHHRQRRDVARARPLDDVGDGLAARVRSQTSRLAIKDDLRRVERALAELDEPQREVILLRKLEELGFREIGERMGRSPDACRMLLARAMAALTLKLQESGR